MGSSVKCTVLNRRQNRFQPEKNRTTKAHQRNQNKNGAPASTIGNYDGATKIQCGRSEMLQKPPKLNQEQFN